MRKIVAGLFMLLDGVVEAPDKWTLAYFNDGVGQVIGGRNGRLGHPPTWPTGKHLFGDWTGRCL